MFKAQLSQHLLLAPSSLNFATKSKTIENAPIVNTISQDEPSMSSALSDTPKLGQALRVAVLRGKKRTRKRLSDSAVDRSAKRRLYDPFRWTGPQSGSIRERENDGYDDTDRSNYYSRMMKPWKRFAAGNYDPWPRFKLNDEQVEAQLESRVAVLVAEKVQDLQKSNTELK